MNLNKAASFSEKIAVLSRSRQTGSLTEQLTDKELVELLKRGNPNAVRFWFANFHPQLLLLAKQKISSVKDAEDVTQEVMINSLRRIHLFRGEASLKTWMNTILRHEIADYYRKKYAKRALKVVPLGKKILAKPMQDSSELQTLVKGVLRQMPSSKKTILLMKYVDELNVKEIAKRLGKSIKAAESEIWRSRQLFKQLYLKVTAD